MDDNNIRIDERNHQRIPSLGERLIHALLAVLLGFFLVIVISFWMFPGVGLGGLYMFSSAHSLVGFIGEITNIAIIAFLAICAVFGWFTGRHFIHRLKGFITWWKFW